MDILCRKILDHPKLAIVYILGCRFHMSELTRRAWNRDVLWLVAPTWCVSADPWIRDGISKARDALPDSHSIRMLVDEPGDVETFESLDGVGAEYISNNIFIPVETFNIQRREKFFDAVVNAVGLPFKRTHLCAGIDELCCLRRNAENTDFSEEGAYDAAQLKPKMLNHRSVSKREVARFLNESYCGVILSELEGNCRAAAEYLFCGIPVVSTPSRGGRAAWFNDYNSIIVEPDEDSVREAVLQLKEKVRSGAISGERIRADALAFRQSFLGPLSRILSEHLSDYGLGRDASPDGLIGDWLNVVERETNEALFFPDETAAHSYINTIRS